MTYLHGIQMKEGPQATIFTTGDTSVIAIVGTSPKGSNEPHLVTSPSQAVAEYGPDIDGFTIPAALETIFSYISPKVIVINILTAAKAKALLEANGTMTRNASGVVATNIYQPTIPAAVDYSTEILAALTKLLTLDSTMNVKPNVILVPGYSHLKPISSKMIEVADKVNGAAYIDIIAPTVQAALTIRSSGDCNISTPSAVLCYPQVVRYNASENTSVEIGLSVHLAAAKARRDSESGYHISPSNTQLVGALKTTTNITSSLTDESADTNLLNAQGIVTVFTKSGAGSRIWGNWTSAFPLSKRTVSMIAAHAVKMAIREALINSSLEYLDKTSTKLGVDLVKIDVNMFLNSLAGKGAIENGSCSYDESLNPNTDVAQGKLVFTIAVTYNASLELITYYEKVEV